MQATSMNSQQKNSQSFIPNHLQVIDAEPGKIGAEIVGLDVNTLSDDSPELELIRDTIYKNKLVVLRHQEGLSAQEYVDFAKKLGRPQVYFQPQYHHPKHPEIFVSSNILENGQKIGVSGTGKYWHTDCAFEKKPLSFTSVLPQVFPESARMTYYLDMHQVYLNLPADLRKLVDNAQMIHEGQLRYKIQITDIDKSLKELLERINEEVPPVTHPAVIEHPVTGDKILYMSSGFTTKMVGLNHEENQQMMKRLFAFIEQDSFIHTHYWEKGDLMIWDNRYLNHQSSSIPQGEASKMYRIGIYDDQPFYNGLEK